MDKNCYTFKKLLYEKPIFNKNIDATYIIHLENNGRYNNIIDQLENYNITNTVYILFNKGYKKCKKQKYITNSPYDLVDAFLTIFKHAKDMNYNNILILEDDFIFNKEIKNEKNINNINQFLVNNKDESFLYYLGCVPYLLIPYNNYTFRNCISAGTHAVIYSKNIREEILSIKQKQIIDWDYFTNLYYFNKRFCYYKPLCYQLFPETENSKQWFINNSEDEKKVLNFGTGIIVSIYNSFKMDKKPEPGFSNFYFLSKINFIFILISLLFLCQFIVTYQIKN